MNVVADTNVMVSALLWRGIPHRILTAAEDGRFALYASPALVDELLDVLARAKFSGRLAARQTSAEALTRGYLNLVQLIVPPHVVPIVVDDPDDDAVLACAVAGHAQYIITGDTHLLRLKSYQTVQIVTPRVFLSSALR